MGSFKLISSMELGNYILMKASNNNIPLTPVQLSNLLYIFDISRMFIPNRGTNNL